MNKQVSVHSLNRKRRAGVLLHPTSFPGPLSSGDLGHEAYRFIEFLSKHGFKVWQMLPLGATHSDNSPYQCLSSHAGNPLLISLDWLTDKGWLDTKKITIKKTDTNYRLSCLQQAANNFYALQDAAWLNKLESFFNEHVSWLDDYCLYIAFKHQYNNQAWYEWPKPARHRDTAALEEIRKTADQIIKQTVFEQFVFFTQWQEIRSYAHKYKIELFGDLPIFVARDSADVWSQIENFLINNDGEMEFIAGVPPDAFSDTGQRWGNPLFDWQYMQKNQFNWWKERFTTQLKLFDMVRIDHFRGLQACWQIPQHDDTAINGAWVEVPGAEMLSELYRSFSHLPLVAEDLGVITDQVIELKNAFQLPGMKVLQFAFDGNSANPHLPHQHELNDVVYSGTHDNDTTLGWLNVPANYNSHFLNDYTAQQLEANEQGVLAIIRLAMASVSFLSVVPMQDLLMLDSSARMNMPGTASGNWHWRFDWQQARPEVLEKISHFLTLYQR